MRKYSLLRGLTPIIFVGLLAACGTAKRSVHYQNDGPPDRAPGDMASIADATPKVEPIVARGNRPYIALGRSYTPLTSDSAFRQRGIASWYGKQFHGNRTASGEIYDMFAMTAAHPTMPIPSYARVTSVRTRESVIVRVNDRGPFKHDRVIDLSYAAASRLGIAATGTGEVEVERITNAQIASGQWRGAEVTFAARPPVSEPAPALGTPALGTAPSPSAGAGSQWAVQLGAFEQQGNAESFAARVATLLGSAGAPELPELPERQRAPRVEHEDGIFRVLIGLLPDRSSALALAQQLERILERPASLIVR